MFNCNAEDELKTQEELDYVCYDHFEIYIYCTTICFSVEGNSVFTDGFFSPVAGPFVQIVYYYVFYSAEYTYPSCLCLD